MESTERLVQTWMASGREEELNQVVSDIAEDRSSLINVVKALGEYLTSEDSAVLQKGVEFLALTVARCPKEKLNRQTVRVLISFFVGKLDDSVTVKPALGGLVTLASLPILTPAEVTTILEGIFRHIKMKGLVQDVRFRVFSIIDTLMAFHRPVLISMGKPFLDGYIGLAEGEKDPRNLMVAFAIARVILIDFDITHHVESMFNILFCYFPITFRPPPNDKYGITTDDLRMSLRSCLNATPSFGPLAIPVFLEKISAGSRATKKDALQTLSSCIPVYGAALGRVSARKLWNALKLEIFQPVDAETEEEALKTTQILVQTIYADEEAAVESNEDIQGLARDACTECINILKEPEKTQARAASKVLCAFMSTTPSVARYTISHVVPHLIRLFHNPDETSARPATLVLLSDLLAAARDTPLDKTDSEGPLVAAFKDELLGVFSVGASSPTTRNMALSGTKVLVTTKGLLSDEELGFVVHKVNDIIEGPAEELDEARSDVLALLESVSEAAPRHVAEQTLPILFGALPDSAPSRENGADRIKIWQTLSALESLCVQQELFEILVIRLSTKLDLICLPPAESTQSASIAADPEPTAAYAHMILKTLAQTLKTKVGRKDADVAKYVDRLVPSVFNLFAESALLSAERAMVATDARLIQVAAEIVTSVIQTLSLERQQVYAPSLFKAVVSGDFSDISRAPAKPVKSRQLSIFTHPSIPAHRNVLSLLTAAVIALHKQVQPLVGDAREFLDMVLKWVLDTADTDVQRLSALKMVASIVNRHADALPEFLSQSLDTFWSTEIQNTTAYSIRRVWAIKSWTWICKSLLVRNHKLAMPLSERLYTLFDDSGIAWDAAKALGEIASQDTVLTKANHADIKILYVQKYVGAVLPMLLQFGKDTSVPARQTAALVALTSLIKSIPRASYVHELPSLIPLLLLGLDLPDADIRSNVIDTFLAAAEGENPEKSLVSEHSVTLVNAMLKNSKVSEMPSSKVRTSALRYLAVLPSIVRYDVLHPYRATVLRELSTVLDDPKRSVRKEAVDARTNWFKYKG